MTDQKISDEARKLVAAVLKASLYENISKGANPALVAQAALTAARVKALEDAAKLFDSEHNAGQTIARAIRAMKVQT